MQNTPEALQSGAAEIEKKLNRANTLLVIATTMAGLAFCVAVYALVH